MSSRDGYKKGLSLPRLRSVLLFIAMFPLQLLETARAQPSNDEFQVKALFLFHFAQLVEWPADASSGSGNQLILCTLEDDAFTEELENTIQGKQIGSRPIRVRYVHLSQAAHGCNMLVIDKSEDKHLPLILANLRNAPILTIGEGEEFVSAGGMIRLFVVANRLRFDVNLAAADSSHLKISSQLLLLASSVTHGRADEGR